jgi:hypothetical protein
MVNNGDGDVDELWQGRVIWHTHHMTGDLVTALFEIASAIYAARSVQRLWIDRQVRGFCWEIVALGQLWGIWNLYYYQSLDQRVAFCAAIALMLVNTAWLMLALRFRNA